MFPRVSTIRRPSRKKDSAAYRGGLHSALLGVGVLLVGTLCGACGLPGATPVLPDPETTGTPSGSRFTFVHPGAGAAGVENVRGYELYYKFYAPGDQEITNALDDEDATAISEAGLAGRDPASALGARGFSRVVRPDREAPTTGAEPPLVPIDPADRTRQISIVVDFETGALDENEPEVRYDTTAFSIRRSEVDEDLATDAFETFLPRDLDPGIDSDLPQDLPAAPGSQAGLSLFTFAFGDGEAFEPIYSTPVGLGVIPVTVER